MPLSVAVPLVAEETSRDASAGVPDKPSGESGWRVLWTRSHCEGIVYDQLTAKGYRLLLPMAEVWSRRTDVRKSIVRKGIRLPLFPGYLFLDHPLDETRQADVLKARGLVRMLGDRWGRSAVVPAAQIETIRRVIESRLPARPHHYLSGGPRARIVRGPLRDVEGVFAPYKRDKGLLVVSVDLLHRSVAVEVECNWVQREDIGGEPEMWRPRERLRVDQHSHASPQGRDAAGPGGDSL